MSIRPPRSHRPARNIDRQREFVTIIVVSFALTAFGLRALQSLIGAPSWTVTWRVVELPTMIFIVPLERWGPMQRTVVGRLTIAEMVASLLVFGVSIVILSSLANRRR